MPYYAGIPPVGTDGETALEGPTVGYMHMYFEAPLADPQGARGQWEMGPLFRPSRRVGRGVKATP